MALRTPATFWKPGLSLTTMQATRPAEASALARVPIKWNHFSHKELEHVGIEKVEQLL
jgi:hypothetical protein